ncbi:hypothetical protein KEM54_000714 [Ascosphaera aggregata]|nr:hypothetical protein KEM54_000714 [Ascosphaera aggregata]
MAKVLSVHAKTVSTKRRCQMPYALGYMLRWLSLFLSAVEESGTSPSEHEHAGGGPYYACVDYPSFRYSSLRRGEARDATPDSTCLSHEANLNSNQCMFNRSSSQSASSFLCIPWLEIYPALTNPGLLSHCGRNHSTMSQSAIKHVEENDRKHGAFEEATPVYGPEKKGLEAFATATELERTDSLNKKGINFDRIDKEVAQYVSETSINIDEKTNTRLRRMIHKRVLIIMIATYFLQALDKGTMSFTSIMSLREDLHLHGQQVWEVNTLKDGRNENADSLRPPSFPG